MPQSAMDFDHADELPAIAARACARLRAAGCAIAGGGEAAVAKLAIASDFAIHALASQPELLPRLQLDAATPVPAPVLDAGNRGDWGRLLRRFRHAESTRLVWRDVVDAAPVGEILAGSTALADQCLRLAHDALETELVQRYGVVRDADGKPQRLVVFGLGKLGGGELNFSSDVDLVYAYEHEGESDGARSLDAQDWFARLGHICPNHLTGESPESVVSPEEAAQVRGRSMLVQRLKPIPVEAVVRGYPLTALLAVLLVFLACLAIVRYDFRGKETVNTLLVAPVLIPETVLAVGLLLFMQIMHQPRSFLLLLLGHVLVSLPYVVLVVQARLVGIRRVYEDAAMSLGANRFQTFKEVTLPLLMPAVMAGVLFSFTISFDNITATAFWRPGGVETVPTQIFGMLRNSISPEINALGTVMIVITVGLPLMAAGLARLAFRGRM